MRMKCQPSKARVKSFLTQRIQDTWSSGINVGSTKQTRPLRMATVGQTTSSSKVAHAVTPIECASRSHLALLLHIDLFPWDSDKDAESNTRLLYESIA